MLWSFQSLRGFSLSALTRNETDYIDVISREVTYPVANGAIGKVREFYFDDHTWTVRYLVVETGSWLSGRNVLILPKFLGRVDLKKQKIEVGLTKEQVENSPSIDTAKPVSRQHEAEYLSYYGVQPYWLSVYAPVPLAPIAAETPRKKKKGDPHLRSSREVTGYRIEAGDGHVGHVEDFVIDDGTWRVHYLVADTRDWWPGRMVLVAPSQIEKISWKSGAVSICLPRSVIERAPEYDGSRPISAEYEQRLHDYYNALGTPASATAQRRPAKTPQGPKPARAPRGSRPSDT